MLEVFVAYVDVTKFKGCPIFGNKCVTSHSRDKLLSQNATRHATLYHAIPCYTTTYRAVPNYLSKCRAISHNFSRAMLKSKVSQNHIAPHHVKVHLNDTTCLLNPTKCHLRHSPFWPSTTACRWGWSRWRWTASSWSTSALAPSDPSEESRSSSGSHIPSSDGFEWSIRIDVIKISQDPIL